MDIARCAKKVVGRSRRRALLRSLRDCGYSSIRDVETAVMETNGSLTIRLHGDKSRRLRPPARERRQFTSTGWCSRARRGVGQGAAWANRYSSAKQVFLAELADGSLEVVLSLLASR